MTVRRPSLMGRAAVAVVANVGLIAPAAMAAPKSPTGCSYNTTTKSTTCVTTTVGGKTYEVGQTDNQGADNSYAGTFCAVRSPNYSTYSGGQPVSTLSAQTTTVTTSTYQGRNTNKPATGTSSVSTTTYTVETNVLGCLLLDPVTNPTIPGGGGHTWVVYQAGETAAVTVTY